jgi:ATP/maltotriose-dependent transcriptional regulator MalT
MSAQLGFDHHWTQMYRGESAQYQIDLGRLDEAARTIVALEQSYQRKSDSRDADLARLHGVLAAQLAIARGKPAAAGKLTRSALEAWDELHGDKTDRWLLWLTLCWSLADQERWTDAEAALAKSREFTPKTPADAAGRIEAMSARVALGLGKRDEAVAAATHARDLLAKFPADFVAHRDIERVLGHH